MDAPSQEYRSIVSDNRRWAAYVPRPGDVFVCTPPKCGTTWMQAIVTALIFPSGAPGPVFEIAPWIDARFESIDDVGERLEAQTHRRQVKTHTPAAGIPWLDDVRYIVVARDGRDAFMSFHNHMLNMQPALMDRLLLSAIDEGIGMDAPPPPVDDVHAFFAWWVEHGNFFEHAASFWEWRDRPNVLLAHYNDLKADLDGQMRQVASFLDVDVDESHWPAQVASCTFEGMRARPTEIADFEQHFVGGAETFLYKATNGRWRDILTPGELATYDATVASALTTECARWLASGSG